MKWLLAILILVVIVLHQDFWLWGNTSLVFGFLPVGLAYHVGYVLLASATMWTLVRVAWPTHLEQYETASSAALSPNTQEGHS